MLIAVALAAEPPPPGILLYEAPVEAAFEVLHEHLGTPEVSPRRPSELAPTTLVLVGGAREDACAGPPARNADLLRILGEAEELRVAMRAAEARARIEAGVGAWACLAEPADPSLGARLYFLRGIHAVAAGDEPAGEDAFAAALACDPGLAWDTDFSPGARAAFERAQARPSPPAVALQLVPARDDVALRVDGRVTPAPGGVAQVPAGRHLLQLGDGAGGTFVVSGDGWLVLPGRVDDALVREAATAEGRHVIEGLLRASAPSTPVYVPSARGVWTWSDDAWSRSYRSPLRRLAWPSIAAGVAATAAGATWMSVEAAAARERLSVGGLDTAGHEALEAAHTAGQTRWGVAAGLTALGGVVMAGGVTVLVATW